MRKKLLISFLILKLSVIVAQERSYIDNILYGMILNEVELYDEEFKRIKTDKIKLVKIDTVINCEWTRPKFIDNVYHAPFDGVEIEHQISYDTCTNEIDTRYLNFIIKQFDENGKCLKDTIAFLVNKENIKEYGLFGKYELVENLKNTAWKNDKIELYNKEIKLDSCHNNFRLKLNRDFSYAQFYGDGKRTCSTEEMKEQMGVSIEGDRELFFEYKNKVQGHYLNFQQGNWIIEKKELKLIDSRKKKVLIFEIEKLAEDELHLKLKGMNYKIKMKKASR